MREHQRQKRRGGKRGVTLLKKVALYDADQVPSFHDASSYCGAGGWPGGAYCGWGGCEYCGWGGGA